MATRTTPVRKAWRALTWLLILMVGLGGLLFAGTKLWGWEWAPRLALDLEGGTQLILQAQLGEGQQVSQEQLDQAVAIIRQRVDASGVSEAEITTQGGQNVVVAIPGEPDQGTLDRIRASAKMEFRPVLLADLPSDESVTDPSATATPGAEDEESAEPEPSESLESTPSASPTDASDPSWITPALQDQFDNFDCATVEDSGNNVADPSVPLVTCDNDGTVKYLLGPVEVDGADISDASNGVLTTQQGASTGQWAVNLDFNGEGTRAFAATTQRLVQEQGVRNQFAIVLDGSVLIAPTTNAAITNGSAQISGNYTQESSKALADQLKFGALPIGFQLQSIDTISATLGTSQLEAGFIAGLIGLILVVAYSIVQYRALASVTIASLIIAGVLTYFVITILSWREGLRLSIAGVAGLIVAIGFTVDSFIVYFERVRDELRDGRGVTGAVEAGWKRALRTIYAAKGINLLSAVVLFVLAVGNVRGFAYTLGITVVIDVLVVVLFTHPMLQLLSRTQFFSSGHPLSGLDPKALGAVYRGRAEFRVSKEARRAGASREAERRQTIAERKAAENATTTTKDGKR
ncbi:MAG: protein translocase subunit SecD [Microbacteriaceae bacterium]